MDQNMQLEELLKELEELQRRYNFLLSAVDNLPNPVFMKDDDARFFFFNKAYSDFFNMERADYIGKTVLDLHYLSPDARERFQREDLKAIAECSIVSYDTTFVTSDSENHPSLYWSRGFNDEYSGRHGQVGEIVDISKERSLQKSLDQSLHELEIVNEKLKVMAETDHASGLFNRAVLWGKGKELIEKAAKTSSGTCLVMIDLDNFKNINDTFGHLQGDSVLSGFAEILRTECRVTDLPVRYGGDEFLAILSNITIEDAAKVAERIRLRSEQELILPDGNPATVSIGVIEIGEDEEFEKALTRLDDYLYEAKNQGRNRVVADI